MCLDIEIINPLLQPNIKPKLLLFKKNCTQRMSDKVDQQEYEAAWESIDGLLVFQQL